jgi:ribonuclease HI
MSTDYSILKGTLGESYLLQFDGLSEPNPGTSTAGAVIFSPDKKPILETGEFMNFATNNQAEYTGLYIGLKAAIELGVKDILIEGDSQLIINQTQGKWKVKNEGMRILHKKVCDLLPNFNSIGIRHIYRVKNTYADKITNDVLASRKSFTNVL